MSLEDKRIRNAISSLDVVSMIMILFYHSVCYQETVTNYVNPVVRYIISLCVTFGLTTFAFSSGYKLIINHMYDLEDDTFVLNYIKKRFKYLMGIYILYPSICLFIFFLIHIFKLSIIELKCGFSIGLLAPESFFEWFFGALPPVAGHLWFLFIVCIIDIVLILLIHFCKLKGVLLSFFILLIYFILRPHVLTAICFNEVAFYLLMYYIIVAFGVVLGFISKMNFKLFKALIIIESFLGVLFLFEDIYRNSLNIGINEFVTMLATRNIFLKWGLLAPPILLGFFLVFRKLGEWISKIQKYTFAIYLYQYPFIIPLCCGLLNVFIKKTSILSISIFILSLILCILLHYLIERLRHLFKGRT